jgi:hypothetical protein
VGDVSAHIGLAVMASMQRSLLGAGTVRLLVSRQQQTEGSWPSCAAGADERRETARERPKSRKQGAMALSGRRERNLSRGRECELPRGRERNLSRARLLASRRPNPGPLCDRHYRHYRHYQHYQGYRGYQAHRHHWPATDAVALVRVARKPESSTRHLCVNKRPEPSTGHPNPSATP